MSDYQDRELICADCNKPFIFEAGEQKFYAEKNFSDPKRCKGCRAERKAKKQARDEEQQANSFSQVWEDEQKDRGRRRRR